MAKFLLYRLQRMMQNPAAEKVTPGLEAALYLHWITCYEHDPVKFALLEPQLPELRRQLAEYLEVTEREGAAHLELMTATHEGGSGAQGTRDFQPAPEQPLPGRVERVEAQFGYDWVLLSWEPAANGGKPWGYRVYRRAGAGEPELVATACETEVLLPAQPEQVKFYYSVAPFNGAGECARSGDFGVMLNAPDEDEEEPPPEEAPARASPAIPEHELPIRQELGQAMVTFMQKLMATRLGNNEEDSVMRQVATEEYRLAVEHAAAQGIEVSLCWHTLGVWTEEGRERIGYFSRALECLRAETAANPPQSAKERWTALHTEASCLFEIGRVHFYEGPPEAARQFLSEALPLSQQAEALRAAAGVAQDDRQEGRIAELILQLPDEE